MPAKYTATITYPKGTIKTFFEDSSLLSTNTGLDVANMVASVIEGSAIAIQSQTYTDADSELAYQLAFNTAGTAVVQVLTTFTGSSETEVTWYRYRSIAHELPLSDYA